MSEVKVNKVSPRSGTGLQLGDSGDTITIPSGATLANAGTATGFASIAWQSSIVTAATHTASAGQGLWLDTSSNAITLTLPASPSVGDQIIFTDYARNWGTNAVTLSLNGSKFQGNTSPNPVYNTNGQSVDIVFSGTTKGWIPNSDDDVTLETPQAYSASFLVIAGGGSGGSGTTSPNYRTGGGGGAGGYRSSFNSETSGGGGSAESALTLTPGTVYTITIGQGGAGSTSIGNVGGDTTLAGSNITDIVSAGGGYGANWTNTGGAGGSGGGGGGDTNPRAGGSGTANQGFAGGANNTAGNISGGGGGAGAVGADGSGARSGVGGTGVASTITGSSVTRGGGGAGGHTSADGGGAGGGGNSGATNGNGSAGTANTGGGGGASGEEYSPNNPTSGAGGSGVVILSVPDASYSGTTTGSPTVATGVSGQTVITFTGSGSYTA